MSADSPNPSPDGATTEGDGIQITAPVVAGYVVGPLVFLLGFYGLEYSNGGRGSAGAVFAVLAGLVAIPAFWNILDDEFNIELSPWAAMVLFVLLFTAAAYLWPIPLT